MARRDGVHENNDLLVQVEVDQEHVQSVENHPWAHNQRIYRLTQESIVQSYPQWAQELQAEDREVGYGAVRYGKRIDHFEAWKKL